MAGIVISDRFIPFYHDFRLFPEKGVVARRYAPCRFRECVKPRKKHILQMGKVRDIFCPQAALDPQYVLKLFFTEVFPGIQTICLFNRQASVVSHMGHRFAVMIIALVIVEIAVCPRAHYYVVPAFDYL